MIFQDGKLAGMTGACRQGTARLEQARCTEPGDRAACLHYVDEGHPTVAELRQTGSIGWLVAVKMASGGVAGP